MTTLRLFFLAFLLNYTNMVYAQNTFSRVYDIQGTNDNEGIDLHTDGDSLILYVAVNCAPGCCQKSSIIKLDTQGEIIAQHDETDLLPAQFKFAELNQSIYHISQKNVTHIIGEPNNECVGDTLIITKIDKSNLSLLGRDTLLNSDGWGYSISGIIENQHNSNLLFYGQKADLNAPYLDAKAYIQTKNPNSNIPNSIFEFNTYIANNQIVDLQIDDDSNFHFLILGQDDISSGAPIGDEKDPHWHIISTDSMGTILNEIHHIELGSPQSARLKLVRLHNGNYVITAKRRPFIGVGNTANQWDGYRGRILCVDDITGDYVWDYILPYDRMFDNRYYRIFSLALAMNGDILLCGVASDDDHQGNVYKSGFISRIAPDGNLIWNRIFRHKDTITQVIFPDYYYANSLLRAVKELDDGRIVAVGGKYNLYDTHYEYLTWTLSLNSMGCLDNEECQEYITLDSVNLKTEFDEYWPIGTTWYYDYDSVSTNAIIHDYIKYKIVEAYEENNDTIYRISVSKSATDLLLKQKQLKMYFYNSELQGYQQHYDFDARTQYYALDDGCTGNYATQTIKIDSVDAFWLPDNELDNTTIQELVRKQWLSTPTDNAKVIFGIGRESGGLPLFNCTHPQIKNIRCFESDIIKVNFQNPWFQPPACDTVWTELTSGTNTDERSPVRIFPNPVQTFLYIDSDFAVEGFRLVDSFGKVVLEGIGTEIDVQQLESGLYFMEISLRNGNMLRLKVIKI